MDAMDVDFERMLDEDVDFPLSSCVPDSPDYSREALDLAASRRCLGEDHHEALERASRDSSTT